MRDSANFAPPGTAHVGPFYPKVAQKLDKRPLAQEGQRGAKTLQQGKPPFAELGRKQQPSKRDALCRSISLVRRPRSIRNGLKQDLPLDQWLDATPLRIGNLHAEKLSDLYACTRMISAKQHDFLFEIGKLYGESRDIDGFCKSICKRYAEFSTAILEMRSRLPRFPHKPLYGRNTRVSIFRLAQGFHNGGYDWISRIRPHPSRFMYLLSEMKR